MNERVFVGSFVLFIKIAPNAAVMTVEVSSEVNPVIFCPCCDPSGGVDFSNREFVLHQVHS